jgi:hypothetical protein
VEDDLSSVTLRTLMDERHTFILSRFEAAERAVLAALASQQLAVSAAFLASEKAINKAEENARRWQENANEWRGAMQDRETKFASRVEVENEFRNTRTTVAIIEAKLAAGGGKSEGMKASWAILLGAASLIGALYAILGK